MRNSLLTTMRLVLFYTANTLIYLLLLLIIFALDFLHSIVSVYFYRGLCYCATTALLAALPSYFLLKYLRRNVLKLSLANLSCAVSCSFLGACCFFSVIPLAIDRSASVMNLAWMYHHPGPVTKQEMRQVLHEIYTDQYDVISRRVAEQLSSGNIVPVSGTSDAYELTPQGRRFIETSLVLQKLFHADPRFLNPQGELGKERRQCFCPDDEKPLTKVEILGGTR